MNVMTVFSSEFGKRNTPSVSLVNPVLQAYKQIQVDIHDKLGSLETHMSKNIKYLHDVQDDAYYERRRRNNDAAKRSRDARRMKEELIAEKASRLERENGQLRGQVALLKSETARLQLLLFSRQQLPAVSATKTEIKSESIEALFPTTRLTALPSDMEVQP
ncbi:unnamed protein product [Haemonchus placei]|uniref:BZIP domain-containing protein n=1 Tax=Haemonchus placei TaxID=6290 RepID=A0A0N4W0W6_HAEPC|nr:unnamed protein product [Haemonchus placei]